VDFLVSSEMFSLSFVVLDRICEGVTMLPCLMMLLVSWSRVFLLRLGRCLGVLLLMACRTSVDGVTGMCGG
jgi:hypothetical protein